MKEELNMHYNPFDIKNISEDKIVKHIKDLINSLSEDDNISALSENVVKLSDVLYLYGELLVRAQKEYSLIKYQNNTKEVALAYKKKSETKEKYPMTYFSNLSQIEMENDYKQEIDAQMNVNRLKYAYEATQERINAIKKKIDSKKYEF